jgi:hypothetical protein
MKFSTLFIILAVVVVGSYFVPVSEVKDWFYGTSQSQSKSKKSSRNRRTSKRSAKRSSKTRKKSSSAKSSRSELSRQRTLKHLQSQLASKKRRLAKYDSKPWRKKVTRKRNSFGGFCETTTYIDPCPRLRSDVRKLEQKIQKLM